MLALDEPTRGMDRARQGSAGASSSLGTGAAVLVATHDPEFAALFAERVVLLADGAPIADGPAAEILGGGTYFATETGADRATARCAPRTSRRRAPGPRCPA